MSEKYSMNKIVDFLERCNYAMYSDYYVVAIARLRAADALVTAVREESPLSASVRKAIAEYEGKEDRHE